MKMDPEHAYFNESWRNAYPLEYLPNGPHDHVSAPAPYFSAQKRLKISVEEGEFDSIVKERRTTGYVKGGGPTPHG